MPCGGTSPSYHMEIKGDWPPNIVSHVLIIIITRIDVTHNYYRATQKWVWALGQGPPKMALLFLGVVICIELYIVIVHSFATINCPLFYKGRVLKRE